MCSGLNSTVVLPFRTRVLRFNRRTPRRFSSAEMVLVAVGWVMPKSTAALEKLRQESTAAEEEVRNALEAIKADLQSLVNTYKESREKLVTDLPN